MNARVFIVDTNVVAAGLITKSSDSPTARILDAMLTGSLIYLLSADLLPDPTTRASPGNNRTLSPPRPGNLRSRGVSPCCPSVFHQAVLDDYPGV
jgi:hypothetical protein